MLYRGKHTTVGLLVFTLQFLQEKQKFSLVVWGETIEGIFSKTKQKFHMVRPVFILAYTLYWRTKG